MQDSKTRFIRVKGRVVPIRADKAKGGTAPRMQSSNRNKKEYAKANREFKSAEKAHGRRQGKFAAAGLAGGIAAGVFSKKGLGTVALAGAAGMIGAAWAGSKTKKSQQNIKRIRKAEGKKVDILVNEVAKQRFMKNDMGF